MSANPFESRNPQIRDLAARWSLSQSAPDRELIEEQIAELEDLDRRAAAQERQLRSAR